MPTKRAKPDNRTENRKRTLPKAAEPFMFQPGVSGNPGGRPKKKVITEIFEKMLDDPEFVGQVEGSIRKMILSGRMVGQLMLKEMTDRTEGKVTQPIEADIHINLADAIAEARKRVGR